MDVEAVQFLEDWLGRPQAKQPHQVPSALPQSTAQRSTYSMADVEALVGASSTSSSPGNPVFNEDSTNPDGGVKKHDVVIEQEEAPVQEQRHEDALREADLPKNQDGSIKDGDRLREQMQKAAL